MLAVALVSLAGFAPAQPPADPETPPAPPQAAVAATVNGQPITVAQVDAALDVNLPLAPLTVAQRRQLRATVLGDLIDDVLVKQFLAKNGPKVDPAEIDAQMRSLQAKLVSENRTLAQYLKELGQTEAQLRQDWVAAIQLAGYVKQHVTDEQLRAYHAAHRDHFDKVEVRLSHIVIRVGKTAPPGERAAAREKLQALRADILAGKTDFAAAARKFSQCPSALKGGDLGFILRRGLPEDEPIARAAFAQKVGTLSEVVETDYGVHLLLVTDRKPGTPTTVEKCVVEVLEAYTDDFRAELVTKLRKEAKIVVTLP
jgi:peptidyl-prolyl cis-trans isomerase C